MTQISNNPYYIPDYSTPKPVASGSIYIGKPDTDPTVVANRKTVKALQENGSLVTMSQPIATSAGGIPTYNGAAVTLHVVGDYSLTVLNSLGSQVYTVPRLVNVPYTPGGQYYVDSSEADQGIIGGGNSVKDLVDAIGTTNEAVIVLGHTKGSQFTDYTFLTAETIPVNIKIKIEPGARLKPASGITVTITKPEQISASNIQQILTGDGTIAFTNPGKVSLRWAMSGDPDGNTTDYTTPMQKIVDSLPTSTSKHGVVVAPGYINRYKTNLTLPGNMHLKGNGYYNTEFLPAVDATPVLAISDARIHISDIHLYGNGKSTSVYGIRSDRALDGVAGGCIIERFKIERFQYGIYITNNYYNHIRNGRIQTVQYGIFGRNAFNDNTIEEVKLTAFDYGITIYHDNAVDTYGSHANTIRKVTFEGFNDWTAVETVDGKPCIGIYLFNVRDNTVRDCYFEGANTSNAFPVLEGGGPFYGVHGSGGGVTNYVDEWGRDLTQLGLAIGHTLSNITDGSTTTITSFQDSLASNDRANGVLAGGSADNWSIDDRSAVDLDTELSGSTLRNKFINPSFSNQADCNRFVAGVNQQASEISGAWVSKKNGELRFNKATSLALSANTLQTFDLSSNLSAWAGYYMGEVEISFNFTEGGAGAGSLNFVPVGTYDITGAIGAGLDVNMQAMVFEYVTSGKISGTFKMKIDRDARFAVISSRAGNFDLRIHRCQVGM